MNKDYTAKQLKESIERLYSDIDTCITDIIRARLNKDAEGEGKALFKMEGLMVATEQELTCIGDFLGDTDGKALLYAINKTEERTRRDVINKACEWLLKNLFSPVYVTDGDKEGTIGRHLFISLFRKAMGDNSKSCEK